MVTASPIRIAVSGTHSTGKTTLLKRLEMEVRAQGFTVARTHGSLAKEAALKGFPKMQNQTATSTQWLIAAGICAELEATLTADVVLVDRSAFDPLAYFLAGLQQRQEHLDDGSRNLLTSLVATHSAGYTLLLATALDPTVPLGNHRDRDLNFRTSVDQHLHQLLANTQVPHLVVTNTEASHDQARTTVLAAAHHLAGAS